MRHLSPSTLYELAAPSTPEAAIAEVVASTTPLTVRAVKEIISAHKEDDGTRPPPKQLTYWDVVKLFNKLSESEQKDALRQLSTSATTTAHLTLQVAPHASQAVIKAAHKALASVHHPDKGGGREEFQRVQGAYESLRGGFHGLR